MRNAPLQGLELIAGYLNDDTRIKTIFSINEDELDFNKRDLYPMANVRFNSSDFTAHTVTYEVTVIDQRDTNKKQITDKFRGNDNRWDNWALAHDVLNILKNKLMLIRNDFDITLVSATSPELIDNAFANGLDGMSYLVTLNFIDRTAVC